MCIILLHVTIVVVSDSPLFISSAGCVIVCQYIIVVSRAIICNVDLHRRYMCMVSFPLVAFVTMHVHALKKLSNQHTIIKFPPNQRNIVSIHPDTTIICI